MNIDRIQALLVVAASACAMQPDDPATAVAPAPAAAEDRQRSTPVAAEPEEELDEAPAAPPHKPALGVALEGRCEWLTSSSVDGQVFATFGRRFIGRVGEDGSIAERLPSPDPTKLEDGWHDLTGVAGRHPNQLFLLIDASERAEEAYRAARLDPNEGWVAVRPFGKTGHVTDIFPWYERSILALGRTESGAGGFAVVRGQPKGPKLTSAIGKARGDCGNPSILAVDVIEDGKVTAVWECQGPDGAAPTDARTFVTQWAPGDLAGTTSTLAPDGASVSGVLVRHGPKGEVWIGWGYDKVGLRVADADGWKEVTAPAGNRLGGLAIDAKGVAHVAVDGKLWQRSGDGWRDEGVPGDRGIEELAGFEHATPWLRRGGPSRLSPWEEKTDARVYAKVGDAWEEVEVPASAFFAGKKLGVTRIHVAAAGDVWLDAHYYVKRQKRGIGSRSYRALVTTRAVEKPLRCGEVVSEELRAEVAPWPTAVNDGCKDRLALLFHKPKWDDAESYPKLRKAIGKSGKVDLGRPRLVELEVGGEKFLGAIVQTDTAAQWLVDKALKLRPYKFPEVVCGDQAVLDAAGVVVHRELALDPAAAPG